MGLRDILRKKENLSAGQAPDKTNVDSLSAPEFTFIRSDTTTEERIYPPAEIHEDNSHLSAQDSSASSKHRRSLDVFRSSRSRSASHSSQTSLASKKESGTRRISQRFHLSRAPPSSENVPDNLPDINVIPSEQQDKDGAESQWEKRATMLASQNDLARSRPTTPVEGAAAPSFGVVPSPPRRQGQDHVVSSKAMDDDIQEAIRLHEEGDLEKSTALFGRLADPQGANNPLSQVLYGLALR